MSIHKSVVVFDPDSIAVVRDPSVSAIHSSSARSTTKAPIASSTHHPSVATNIMSSAYLALSDLTQEYDGIVHESNLTGVVGSSWFGARSQKFSSFSPSVATPPAKECSAADMAPLRAALDMMSHEALVQHCIDLHAIVNDARKRSGMRLSSTPFNLSAAPSLHMDASQVSTVFDPVKVTNELVKSTEEDGTKLINHYVILDELGRGSCRKVKLAFDSIKSTMVAIKIVRRAAKSQFITSQQLNTDMALEREIAVMKKMRHQNIVSLYEVIDDPEAQKLYLVMQHVDQGAIGTIDPLTYTCGIVEHEVLLEYCRQMLSGLEYLHARHVFHRDIKPENILLSSEGGVFLADFGVSEMFERANKFGSAGVSGQRGTKLFMAPELLETGSARSGRAVDMWALGVTIYALLVGKLPFTTEAEIRNGPNPVLPAELPPIWSKILNSMLDRNSATRITAREAKEYVKEALAGRLTESMSLNDANETVDMKQKLTTSEIGYAMTPMSTRRGTVTSVARESILVAPGEAQYFLNSTSQQLQLRSSNPTSGDTLDESSPTLQNYLSKHAPATRRPTQPTAPASYRRMEATQI